MEKQCLSYTTFSHGTKIKPMTGILVPRDENETQYNSWWVLHPGPCWYWPLLLDTWYWLVEAPCWHRGYYRHQTPALPCYAAQPWPPPWLPHQGQEIPSPATKIPGVTHSRALTPASSLQGGRRQNLYLYYIYMYYTYYICIILVYIQGGSDLKCGFPQHLDNWD